MKRTLFISINTNHLGAAVLLSNSSRQKVLSIEYSPSGEATLTGNVTYNPRAIS